MNNRTGDLEFGKVVVGKEVRCVIAPDMAIWKKLFPLQAWIMPEVGTIYILRSNVIVPIEGSNIKEILLKGIQNVQVNHRGISAEPCFPCNAFCSRQ